MRRRSHSKAIAALAEIERTRAGFAQEREAILAAAREAAERARTARLDEAAKEAAALAAAQGGDREGSRALAEKAWAERASRLAVEIAGTPRRPPRWPSGARRIPGLAAQGNSGSAGSGAAGRGGEWRRSRSDQRDAARRRTTRNAIAS